MPNCWMNCTWPLKLRFSYKRCNFVGFNKGSETTNAKRRNPQLDTFNAIDLKGSPCFEFFFLPGCNDIPPSLKAKLLREPPTSLMSVVNHVRTEYLCVESPEIDSAFKESHRVFSDPIFTQNFKDFWLKHLSICQNLHQNLLEICTSQDPRVGMGHGFPRSEDFLPCSVALLHSIRSNTVHEVMTNPMQKIQQMWRGKKRML